MTRDVISAPTQQQFIFFPAPIVQQIKLQKVIKGSVFPTDISLSQQFWNKDK